MDTKDLFVPGKIEAWLDNACGPRFVIGDTQSWQVLGPNWETKLTISRRGDGGFDVRDAENRPVRLGSIEKLGELVVSTLGKS